MMRLLLIRHGFTRANDERLYCGSTDLPLSENGRQALETLRLIGGYPPLDGYRVFTSGMCRTEETLLALYGETRHDVLPAMREMDFGRFEMHSYEQLKEDPEYRRWCEGDNEANVAPEGESGRDMQRRVLDALHLLIREDLDTALVLHGGPIAAIMADLFPEEGKNRFEWQPSNGKGFLIFLHGEERSYQRIPM